MSSPNRSNNGSLVPDTSSPGRNGYTIGLRRTGQTVEITLMAVSEYASIELYDQLIASIEKGTLRLELNVASSRAGRV